MHNNIYCIYKEEKHSHWNVNAKSHYSSIPFANKAQATRAWWGNWSMVALRNKSLDKDIPSRKKGFLAIPSTRIKLCFRGSCRFHHFWIFSVLGNLTQSWPIHSIHLPRGSRYQIIDKMQRGFRCGSWESRLSWIWALWASSLQSNTCFLWWACAIFRFGIAMWLPMSNVLLYFGHFVWSHLSRWLFPLSLLKLSWSLALPGEV